MLHLRSIWKKAVVFIVCGVLLGISFNAVNVGAETPTRMYVDTYPPSGSGDIIDETLRPGQIPISGTSLISSYPSGHYSGYGYINSFPSNYATNGSVTNAALAYDQVDATYAVYNITLSAPLTGPPGPRPITYFELAPFNASGSYTIAAVDFKVRFETYIFNMSQYRILYEVGAASQVLWDWSTSTESLSTREWYDQPEPNDGVWSMADIGNIKVRFEAQKSTIYNASETGGHIKVNEVSVVFTVTPLPAGFLTNPTLAYDKDQATYAEIDISKNIYPNGFSWFAVRDFNTSIAKPYQVLGVTIRMKYTVTPLTNAQYRIVMSVGDAYDELQTWSATPRTSTTPRVWTLRAEPNDGVWNWTDINNMRISLETKKTTAAGAGLARPYEIWIEVQTDRLVLAVAVEDVTNLFSFQFSLNWTGNMFDVMDAEEGQLLKSDGADTSFSVKKYNGATGNYTLISNTRVGTIVGVSGSGVLAYIEFLVQDYGCTNLQLYNTGMADSFLLPIDHTTTDGYFKNKLTGDADGDGTVNVFDITLVQHHWYPGPPAGLGGYSRDVDIDDDGAINVFDIVLIQANWDRSV